jgi:nicotinate-nucleotide adenylyltransferase
LLQLVVDELNSSNKNACVFDVETCELNRDGFSYTIDTLQLLRQQSPNDRIVWVVGMDSLVNLSTWRCWRELLEWSNLLVVTRPGWSLPASGLVFEWMHNKIVPPKMLAVAGGISIVETTPMAISSRAIREQFGLGQEPKNLLSESVLTYIAQHQLY